MHQIERKEWSRAWMWNRLSWFCLFQGGLASYNDDNNSQLIIIKEQKGSQTSRSSKRLHAAEASCKILSSEKVYARS
jgi:hypothetical protein